jgi:Spy/CpxP family protein refolding chaperone
MNAHLESLGRVKLQGVLLLAVVFGIGAFAGAAFERAREARPGPPPRAGQGVPPAWRQQLRLTDDQDRQIREILEKNRSRADAILEQFLPRLRVVTDSVRAEVRTVLTPDQQEMFDRLQPPLGPPLREGRPPFEGPPPDGPHPGGPPPGGHPPGGPPPGGLPPGGHPPGGPPPHGRPARGEPPPGGPR